MNIPKVIWICGMRYDIRKNSNAHGFGCWGSINFPECYIELNPQTAMDFLREILLHEILHGIDRSLVDGDGLVQAMRRAKSENGLRLHEHETLALSRGIWLTLTDPRNREAVDWILGR